MEDSENYNDIIETLTNTFGNVLSRDVLFTIIESCGGNLEQAANAVMSITMDGNCITSVTPENAADIQLLEHNNNSLKNLGLNESEQHLISSASVNTSKDNLPSSIENFQKNVISYATASQSSKPLSQQATMATSTKPPLNTLQNIWTTQLRQILRHHENGARILILMRGVPGSGKSHLAKQILDSMLGSNLPRSYFIHILSTDDFFMHRGVYNYDKFRLPEAHEWNRNRASQAMRQGLSPVIIDNTNIECFEMEGYVREGVRNGYIIEVVEPNTPWAKKANQLLKRNTHNVPIHTIRRMLDNYENGITGAILRQRFNCYYSPQMQPPVLRSMPPIVQNYPEASNVSENVRRREIIHSNNLKETQATEQCLSQNMSRRTDANNEKLPDSNENENSEVKSDSRQTILDSDQLEELRKCFEEMERVEREWDNGDDWNERTNDSGKEKGKALAEYKADSKPQRRNKSPRVLETEKLIPSLEGCQDWSNISVFLPSWGESSAAAITDIAPPVIEKKSCGTCIEVGDHSLDTNSSFKHLKATPRNINEFYVASKHNKIPEKWLLDKSTSTSNDEILTNSHRCQHEEQHFEAFRKLFKNISQTDLRDIFDNCCGDVNWAVEIVLDGMENKKFGIIENNDTSDSELDTQGMEVCQCLSAYGILPDNSEQPSANQVVSENTYVSTPSFQLKKVKKEMVVSEASMELKRQIEENVTISDSHYSEHCLKIRNFRRGDNEVVKTEENNSFDTIQSEPTPMNTDQPSLSENENSVIDINMPSTSKLDSSDLSDEDSSAGFDDTESTININLGTQFIAQLDKLFGRNIEYPKNVNLRINMPMSLLNEINALWMESLMHQLEEDAKQSELMIQQDEDFARQLAVKEAELSEAGKEPAVPDFKEIMDMDFAVSLYHKDVAECLNSKPLDLAAKLSREKLYNLFPDIEPSVLSELLAAHEENFQSTVEVLLISTGKGDLLNEENGINKFVMEKELERQQEKLAQEEKKTLSEVEWPLLPKWENVDMSVVEEYRAKAEKHLQARNLNYMKAQDYIRRGITTMATHCSEIAAFHKRKYEHANSLAAASLMQVHASKNTDNATIDLHYLRVGEAKESLDLFLDTHIQKLKEVQDKNIVKHHTLFFITGRGLHSHGGPRVKPAVKKRLRERGLNFSERNPGLLTAKVSANDKLSYQIA